MEINQTKLVLAMMQHILIVKYLAKRTSSDQILKDRDYEIARNHKYDGYQRALASMVYKFLIRKQDRE